MEYLAIVLVAALTFGVCFLLDRLFTKKFRGKKEHQSGKSVRLNKRYGSIGLIIAVLGVSAVIFGFGDGWFFPVAGGLLTMLGGGLVAYYMTFGVFYDDDGFLLTTFGERSTAYAYRDIRGQQLYTSGRNVVIELALADGRSVQLQSNMEGVYPFLDHAFSAWLEQTGRRVEDCDFYDPENSCWFPGMEG